MVKRRDEAGVRRVAGARVARLSGAAEGMHVGWAMRDIATLTVVRICWMRRRGTGREWGLGGGGVGSAAICVAGARG